MFAGEIRSEFGLSHGTWGTLYSIGTLASAIVMVWAGILTDVLRVRILGPIILVTLAASCAIMASASSLWMLVLAIFGLRFAGQGMSSHIGVVAVSRWFNANRGKAIAVAILGLAAGEALLPLVFAGLLPDFGWRTLWIGAAVCILAFIPILWPLLRLERTPQSVSETSHSTGMNGRHWSRRDMLRNPLFWFFFPALLAPAAFATAFFFQQVHVADVKGWSHVTVVSLFPVFTLSGISAMLFSGWLVDRIGSARMIPYIQLPMAAGFLLFSQADTIPVAAVAMAMMGMTQGCNTTVTNTFWAEFFGTRHLGAIKSLATSAMVLGTAIGPILSGIAIDAGVPFPEQMPFITVYFLFGAMMIWIGVRRARPSLTIPA